MFSNLDNIVNSIVNNLRNTDYDSFKNEYILFINELIKLLGNEEMQTLINMAQVNEFLAKLDSAYRAWDVMELWDLFRYEYWNTMVKQ